MSLLDWLAISIVVVFILTAVGLFVFAMATAIFREPIIGLFLIGVFIVIWAFKHISDW